MVVALGGLLFYLEALVVTEEVLMTEAVIAVEGIMAVDETDTEEDPVTGLYRVTVRITEVERKVVQSILFALSGLVVESAQTLHRKYISHLQTRN